MPDIITLIEQNMANMSKRQRIIAEYILENYDKASFMTASKLSKEVGVSESTVVRFAAELGFDGYQRLQKALKQVTKNKLNAVQRINISTDRISNENILESVLHDDIQRIQHTLEEIDKEQFNKIVDALINARKIYILGLRSSGTLARFLHFYLNPIFEDVKLVNLSSDCEMFEEIIRVNSEDVLFGISFPRYSKRTIQALEYAKKMGATILGLTDSDTSPVTQVADYYLTAYSDMISFVDSLVAPLTVMNALIVAVGMKKRKEVSETFARLENIWTEYGVYNTQADTKESCE